jgi:hypothetical protein
MRLFLIPLIAISAGAILVALRRPPVNPPVAPGLSMETALRPPQHVSRMLRRACYDCHSNETQWPWYSRVPGLGNMLARDVRRARATFNFSEWSAGPYRKPRVAAAMLLGMCSAIRAGEMPRKNYLMLHPAAMPTPAEADEFCAWGQAEARRLVEDARRSPARRAAQEIPRLSLLQIKQTPD